MKPGLGFGLEASVAYRFAGPFGLYVGWNWFRFSGEESFAGSDANVDQRGFVYGVELDHRLGSGDLANLQWRLGLTYERASVEPGLGFDPVQSSYDFGWAGSLSLAFHVSEHWSLGPAMRYKALTTEFEWPEGRVSSDLRHVSLEAAVGRRF